jgi:protein-S-isoprenylcysteine O-methyltransferase Ste14
MLRRYLRVAPVVVTIVIPILIAATVGISSVGLPAPLPGLLVVVGVTLAVAGLALLAWTIDLFDRVGHGALSPLDPPRVLVVHGPYRRVRNPMFSGVLFILVGEAIAARSPTLLAWFAVFFLFVAIVVPRIEEPGLARRFGTDYTRYRDNVPRWLPRLRPWQPPGPSQTPPGQATGAQQAEREPDDGTENPGEQHLMR